MIVSMIITLSVNVPIDNQIKVWTLKSMPSNWDRIRKGMVAGWPKVLSNLKTILETGRTLNLNWGPSREWAAGRINVRYIFTTLLLAARAGDL